MKFSIIICTYMRPQSLKRLLDSVLIQTLVPNEVIIVDGSLNKDSLAILDQYKLNIHYFLVEKENRGLTKQRNYGISKLSSQSEVAIFLDDDLVLDKNFCNRLLENFFKKEVVGAEGYIINDDIHWIKANKNFVSKDFNYYYFDGYKIEISKRDKIRKILNLFPNNVQPGLIPQYGHGKTTFPPTGKTYEVEHLTGCMMAYRSDVLKKIKFSEFFEGYGLYEDFDFSVRASEFGKLVADTCAKCEHHHDPSGRPNYFKYGKMVVWNGYYVWRLKHKNPGFINVIKWYLITILLMSLRFLSLNNDGLKEGLGRFYSLIKLQFKKPI